jgi:hypothetical protein
MTKRKHTSTADLDMRDRFGLAPAEIQKAEPQYEEIAGFDDIPVGSREISERVARALCKHHGLDPDELVLGHARWHGWVRQAECAIAAMRATDIDVGHKADRLNQETKTGTARLYAAASDLATSKGFTSRHPEDHKQKMPRWVFDALNRDADRRMQLANEIAKGIEEVRAASRSEIPVNKQLYDALKALRDNIGAASLVRNLVGRKLRADADEALLAAQFGITVSEPKREELTAENAERLGREDAQEAFESVRPILRGQKREISALRLREEFVKRMNAIPLGTEDKQRGASAYNWGRHHITVMDEILAEMHLREDGRTT